MSTIDFACPYCERVTRVPLSFAGTQGKCPGCQRVIQVPDPAQEEAGSAATTRPSGAPTPPVMEPAPDAGSAPTVMEPPPPDPFRGMPRGATPDPAPPADLVFDVSPKPRPKEAPGDRPCPACGELIKAGAVKCRYCGEGFVGAGGPFATHRAAPGQDVATPLDYVLAVFCGLFACIYAVVLLAQGQTKRGVTVIAVVIVVQVVFTVLMVIMSLVA